MFSIEDFIITVFCNVDDLWQEITQGQKIRRRGFAPSLSDSEVITMEIVGEFQGIDTDKGIWSYFQGHWLKLFPQMKSRTTFVRQAANLWCYKQKLQKVLTKKLGGLSDPIHLTDGVPMPLCHYQRAKNCRLFSGLASFGYCAAKDDKYYGFKGHLVMSLEGVITGFALTPANGSERDALWEAGLGITGLVIADKGYLGSDLQRDLKNWGINLQTAKRSNMKDNRDREGGCLRFPEYGSELYEPVTGSAIIFSASLLHEVTDLIRGQRFALISFFCGKEELAIIKDYNSRIKTTGKNLR